MRSYHRCFGGAPTPIQVTSSSAYLSSIFLEMISAEAASVEIYAMTNGGYGDGGAATVSQTAAASNAEIENGL